MEDKTRILLVEDDQNLGYLLKQYLNAKSYDAELFADGEKGFKAFIDNPYDLCVLDIMMPVKDGFSLAKEIRSINSDIPIIFLTAKTLKDDVFEGFKIGADDYITKPFSMEEFLLRVDAVLRRTKKTSPEEEKDHYQLGKYTFDHQKQKLIDQENEEEKSLTTKESELLKLLCINKNKILDRDFALRTIWRDATYFNARSMDVYITKLRKYLKDETSISIMNIHGKGFKMLQEEDINP